MTDLNKLLEQFSARIASLDPEVASILERLRAGELGEEEGFRELLLLVGKKGLQKEVERTALDVFQPESDIPMVFQPEGRQPRLNPLVEAAIAERVQFDGDAPELRTGPMPEGATPAVPVSNPSRDLVALGVQLETASAAVTAEIAAAREEFLQQLEDKAEGLDEEGKLALYQEHLPSLPIGVPGYQPGSLPAPREVKASTGTALSRMTPEERRQKAWKALSTTQGRRSALQVIGELVQAGLRSEGFDLQVRPPTRGPVDVKAYAEWKVNISGPEAMQPNFAFLDVAAKSLLRGLVSDLEGVAPDGLVLEVTSIDTVDIRQVGWAARVVSE